MKPLALCLLLGSFFAGGTALAQPSEAPTDAILVFDASGSMWGQIDGVNKIVIARDVVSQLLDELPDNRRLGLVAYGHNRKGDCGDIEMLAPVGSDRETIRKAVMGLNPKGMTPMADAVQQAAEALKYTENKATVILVSDGEETCSADPCGAVAALDKLGVGLTVHTVGFGLESAEAKKAREQLQCMADTTGGKFFTADNAQELTDALTAVALAEPPAPPAAPPAPKAPAGVDSKLHATDGKGGPSINEGLHWTIRDGGTGEILHETDNAGSLQITLKPGIKDVRVERLSDGAVAEGSFNPADGRPYTLPIVVHYSAAISAPDTAAAGSTVRVNWEGPDRKNDYISVERPDKPSTAGTYITYTYTTKGSPLELRMPPEPGTYEIRYIQNQGSKTLAQQTVEVTAVSATLEAPDTAAAGETVRVNWTGPDYKGDYISVERPDKPSTAGTYITYTYTTKGSPLELRMPPEPGTYEIRYIQNQGSKTLAQQTVEVTAVSATLEAPGTAAAGETVRVNWTGPDYKGDYISVERPDKPSTAGTYITYTYTTKGSPLELRMPPEPGTYEIRYIQNQGSKTLAKQTVEVTAVSATLEAPDTAAAGETVRVNWTGPDYKGDYISVERPDKPSTAGTYITYTYTTKGSPLELRMPPEPGTYEIRYIQNQGSKTLAQQTVEVTAVSATLEAPGTAAAGETVLVNWTGPDYKGDYISVERPDKPSTAGTYITYTYTTKGSPLELRMPPEPGTYEIRYIQNQGSKTLAQQTITVTAEP